MWIMLLSIYIMHISYIILLKEQPGQDIFKRNSVYRLQRIYKFLCARTMHIKVIHRILVNTRIFVWNFLDRYRETDRQRRQEYRAQKYFDSEQGGGQNDISEIREIKLKNLKFWNHTGKRKQKVAKINFEASTCSCLSFKVKV